MSHRPDPLTAASAPSQQTPAGPLRFAPEQASGRAAWLWCPERNRLVWASAEGLALWGCRTVAELRHSQLSEAMPAVAVLRRTLCGDPPQRAAAHSAAHALVFWGPRGPIRVTAEVVRVLTDTEALALMIFPMTEPVATVPTVTDAVVDDAPGAVVDHTPEPLAQPPIEPVTIARGRIEAEPAIAQIMAELGRLVAAEVGSIVPAPACTEAAVADRAPIETIGAPLALAPPPVDTTPESAIPEAAVLALLEAFPGGIALARGSQLIGANRAFALAFGHKNAENLISRGGLKKILPLWDQQIGRLPALGDKARDDRKLSFIAQTASGRKLTMPTMVSRIAAAGAPLVMLSLRVPEVAQEPEPEAALSAPLPAEPPKPSQEPPSLGLFAKISHDVRTPLNSIIGFAEMMQRASFGPVTNPRYRGYIDDIHVSATHALSLINDLLDLAKLEAGRFACDVAPLGVNSVVAECVASLEPQARAEDIVVRAALSPDLPPIMADARRMKQVLLNILSNAVKFTDAGGQVIIATSFEQPTSDHEGAVVVRVRDTGRGMNAAELVEALEVFGQPSARGGQALRAASQAGSGLGLPLAKALTEAQGGTLAIESAPGAGTRVTIRFPAATRSSRGDQGQPPAEIAADQRPQRAARPMRAAE